MSGGCPVGVSGGGSKGVNGAGRVAGVGGGISMSAVLVEEEVVRPLVPLDEDMQHGLV